MSTTNRVETTQPIIYPESDGKPMAENTLQFHWIVTIKEGLEALFRDRPDVFIAGDLLWYPVEGDPKITRAPDAMVVFGRPKGFRRCYIQHLEAGIAPQVVFEVLSPNNDEREMTDKRAFYQQYDVQEYYQYDPEPDHPHLRGWIRQAPETSLEPIAQMRGWTSPRLGVTFDLRGSDLVMIGPDGTAFEPVQQWDIDRIEHRRQAVRERHRADQAEQHAEAERQRAEEERQRAEQADQRVDEERQRAEQADQRAEQADQRAEAERLSAEQQRQRAERLAEQLRQLGIDPDAI